MTRRNQMIPIGTLILSTTFLATGCGKVANSAPSSLLVAHPENRTADIYLIAGYNRNNLWENVNGYSNGNLSISVPVGYKVALHITNDGGVPYDIGVYTKDQKLAFTGAGSSMTDYRQNPTGGIMPGSSVTYSFVANRVGDYRLADLLYEFPNRQPSHLPLGMWAEFHVTQSGSPQVANT